jgi:quinol monooxygenase YgiN
VTTISKEAKVATFINVFTVDPANQPRVVELLSQVTNAIVRHAPGFVAARLHRSLDGTRVTMYSQWRSIADYEAMRNDPRPRPYFEQVLSMASFEPGSYEVVEDYTPEP